MAPWAIRYPVHTPIPTCTLTPSHITTQYNKQVASSFDALGLVCLESTHDELGFLQSLTQPVHL